MKSETRIVPANLGIHDTERHSRRAIKRTCEGRGVERRRMSWTIRHRDMQRRVSNGVDCGDVALFVMGVFR